MVDQVNIKNAKYLGIYFNYNGDYTTQHVIFGSSIEHLAEWRYLERPIQRCSKLHMFKVEEIDRGIVEKIYEKLNKKDTAKYKREKKAELLKELKELDND